MREVEHLFYANALGLDYQQGQFVLYAQILNPQTIGKQQSNGKSSEVSSWVGVGKGETVAKAFEDLYSTTQRRVFWGHLTVLLFSENALKSVGMAPFIDLINRYHEFRYLPWVYCTSDSLQDVLLTQPILENTPIYSLLSDPLTTYSQSSFIRPFRLYRDMSNLMEPSCPKFILEVSLARDRWFNRQQVYLEPRLSGIALIRKGRMVGRLGRSELTGVVWCSSHTRRVFLSLREKNKPVAVLVMENPKCRVRPILTQSGLKFDMTLRIHGYVSTLQIPATESKLKALAAAQIRRDVRQTYVKALEMNQDVLGLEDPFYRRHPAAFKRWQQRGGVKLLNQKSLRTIDVQVRIDHSGRTQESAQHYMNHGPDRPK